MRKERMPIGIRSFRVSPSAPQRRKVTCVVPLSATSLTTS